MQPIDVSLLTARASLEPSRLDAAPRSGFREVLARGLAGAGEVARAVLPGGPLVGVALTGLSRLVEPDTAPASSADMGGLLAESRSFNVQYLALQQEMAQESRAYTTLSNIMKARHEAARNAINNIR